MSKVLQKNSVFIYNLENTRKIIFLYLKSDVIFSYLTFKTEMKRNT